MRKVLCQVVGCGPAALGLPVAADRTGGLGGGVAGELLFLDGADDALTLTRLRFPYLIDSNSTGADFLEAIRTDGIFAPVLRGRTGLALAAGRASPVPLALVGAFLGELTDALRESYPDGVVYSACVAAVRRGGDGTWTSVDASGRPIATSRHVVLATGGYEDTARTAAALGVDPERCVASNTMLSGRLDRAEKVLRAGGTLTVLGGSHSGFSVLCLLLDRFGTALRHGALALVYRSLAVSHTSVEAMAEHRGPVPRGAEVCPYTGTINRFHGLRAAPRELCLAVLRGREPRVRLLAASTSAADAALATADLVVHATGYRTRRVPLFDDEGVGIEVSAPGGTVAVDDRCRVLDVHGRPVDGIHGLGLGYARTDRWGRRRVGLNVFHGPDAETILTQLSADGG